jgi:hypothetical protein
VVEKIVGEELLEHRKIPAALHFFRIAPDHCFRGFAGISAAHDLAPCTSAVRRGVKRPGFVVRGVGYRRFICE